MIGIDVETMCDDDDDDDADGNDDKEPMLDLNGQARIQVDTTFCHELFHTFMYDYNRIGMTGFIDYTPFEHGSDDLDIDEEGERLIGETCFPMEPLADVVARTGAFMEALRTYRGNVLVSTHAIAVKGILEYLTPDSNGGYWSKYIGHCAVYTVACGEDGYTAPIELLKSGDRI
jgi:hypothetical protein